MESNEIKVDEIKVDEVVDPQIPEVNVEVTATEPAQSWIPTVASVRQTAVNTVVGTACTMAMVGVANLAVKGAKVVGGKVVAAFNTAKEKHEEKKALSAVKKEADKKLEESSTEQVEES